MKKAKLCLHAGGHQVDFSQLLTVRTPDATETYMPLAHHDLVNRVTTGLAAAGLEIVESAHALAKDGQRYFGLFQVARSGLLDNRDYGLVMGLRNSHDKCFPAGITVGSQVFVCDNLAFSGEIKLARKHTVNIMRDLPGVITRAIGKLGDAWLSQDTRFEAYRETRLTDEQADRLILNAFRNRACVVTNLSDVVKEWDTPSHEEFANRNVWRLLNAFTEGLKGNLGALPERTQKLHAILDAYCGLTPMHQTIDI